VTDAALRDAAVAELAIELAELRETTRGLKGFSAPPGSRWGKALAARERALAHLAQIAAPSPTLPFAEPVLRAGFNSLTMPASATSITAPAGRDCLLDLQGVERTAGKIEIWGSADQRIRVVAGRSHVTKPIDNAPYHRGGFRLRSVDGIGPEHISLTDCLVYGPSVADACTVALGPQSKATLQRCRFESATQTTGQSTPEPGEHCDATQVQGSIGRLEIGLSTLFAASVSTPSNHGGKCLMLEDWPHDGSGFTFALDTVNLRGQGERTGTFLYQAVREIRGELRNVWALKEGVGAYQWGNGDTGLFFPNRGSASVGWQSSGTAPSRVATFEPAANIAGQIREGLPPGGDFVTRAMLGA
jgi:hypothetical protein